MSDGVRFYIVQDYRENRRKCTALPLRDLPGFEFTRMAKPRGGEAPLDVPGGIWLNVGAPVLEPADQDLLTADGRVVVLDAAWARVESLRLRLRARAPLRERSLPAELRTAYPRKSKLHEDPCGGLATVEAVFAVTVIFGVPRLDVLQSYRWADEFLELNLKAFRRLDFHGPRTAMGK